MTHPDALDRIVREVSAQVRWRRAEHHALRGVFYGAVAGAAVLAARGPIGRLALALAIGLLIAGGLAGLVWGLSKRVTPLEAARVADRAFALEDRVATALEWAGRSDRTALVDPLLADATARVEELRIRQIVRRIVPREGKLLPLPVSLAVVLALAPPLPVPSGRFGNFTPTAQEEQLKDRGDDGMLEERSRPVTKDPLRRPAFEERDFAQRSGSGGAATSGDLSAIFKDTSLATQRPDFNSFLKKGDERLKMLEQLDRLPDLQSDFTNTQYKMVFRKSKELTSGLRPDQISPQKLRELLEEMQRMGRKGGNWGSDAAEGMEAMEYGQQDKALQAMEKALKKMRSMDEDQQRSGKNLRGGRDSDRSGRGRDRGAGMGPEDQDFGEGEGLLPGKGRSSSPKGEASHRLRASPYDVGVEGESRRGRKEAYDTNMTGRGGKMESHLQYLGVIGQYRKIMEDAIAREQVPRDYHTQIKDYFQALDER